MRRSAVLAFILTVFGAGVASAQTPKPEIDKNIVKHGYLCSLDDTQHLIQIVYLVPDQEVPCEVHYHKDGEQELLWRADNLGGFCERKAENFAEQHQEWGFACQRLTAAPVALE